MVLQMADDSFATDYKRYEINSVNKVFCARVIDKICGKSSRIREREIRPKQDIS